EHGHRCRRAHAELRFERLHQLRELEHADALDVIDDLLLRHVGHCCLLKFGIRNCEYGIGSCLPDSAFQIPNYDFLSPNFFSYCVNTFIKSRGTACSTDTSCTIGACIVPRRRAYNSALPGSAARSDTSAGDAARPWTTAALMVSVGGVLTNVVSVLASAAGSVSVKAIAVVPSKNFSSGSNEVPFSARFAIVFFTTRYFALAARSCRRSSVTWGTF